MSSSKRLFLLDAYALIYRAYFAFISNPMRNSKGINTSTTFGFTLALDDVLKNQKPTHIAIAFDPPGPTFRHTLFPSYKATRAITPEDIHSSVPYIKKIVEAYNIPVIEYDGFEADDVIGTIAKQAENEGFEVFMMTPDKDFAQLVTPNIKMYKPRRFGNDSEIWGPAEVMQNFEIKDPRQVIDVLALWGDASDNVPGVPGIGEKTAKKIIGTYGSLQNVYDHLDDFKGKLKENMESFREQAFLSLELVTIRYDIPLKFDENIYKTEEVNFEKLKLIFEELEFKSLISRHIKPEEKQIPQANQQGDLFSGFQPVSSQVSDLKNITSSPKNYQLIKNVDELMKLVTLLEKSTFFAFNTENTDTDLLGISFSVKPLEGYYIPVTGDNESITKSISPLKTVFENDKISKIGQNLKFDIRMLKKYGINVKGNLFDTMIAHYLIQPERSHNLNYLAETYLSYRPLEMEELTGQKGVNQLNINDIPLDKIKDYAVEKADLALQLSVILKQELTKSELYSLARDVEWPLIYVLSDMEHEGIKMDITSLVEFRNDLVRDILTAENKIFKLAGEEFNISSPKQLGVILFEKLKIDADTRKANSKQFSTSEEILSKLEGKHEIVSEVLNFRSLKKLLTTYVDALPKLIDKNTGKIHTSFNQTIAATGRLSSNNPNLQNIPIREERGREIRKAFVPAKDSDIFLSADYSQIELRLMAHLSADENMIEAFRKNEDIHIATASKIYKVDVVDVTREMRSRAKTANFGIIYGISSFGLSQRLNISRNDAKELIENYFITFPGIRAYMDESIQKAHENGFVQTMMGRKRYLPDINSRNAMVRGFAERNAINAPLQGSAADFIKLAMIRIHNSLNNNHMRTKMILQVHDELVFEVPLDELEQLKLIVKKEMESVVALKVPLLVDIGTGKNWLEAH